MKKKIIGHQLVDDNNNTPEEFASFEVFPLSFCEKWLKTSGESNFYITDIHEGDIEEPTIYEYINGELMVVEMEGKRTFINYYECPKDGTEWEDKWDCACNDRCPVCNTEVEPYESKEL